MEVRRQVEEQLVQVFRAALRRALAALPAREEVCWGDLEAAMQRALRGVGRTRRATVVRAVGSG